MTFENVQAGLRTDYLFRLANQRGGIVLGTGDMSELALGWCTYGVGDQMSHYRVNAGMPKTLIQHLIRWVIGSEQFGAETRQRAPVHPGTEISPELVPPARMSAAEHRSEDRSVRAAGLQPVPCTALRLPAAKIAFLARHAWPDVEAGAWPPGFPEDKRPYDLPDHSALARSLRPAVLRFSQFKRSALPNGPKVVAGGSLSPRGEWRAPSDMSARIWLDEIEREVPEE